jgi:hypothetical protein
MKEAYMSARVSRWMVLVLFVALALATRFVVAGDAPVAAPVAAAPVEYQMIDLPDPYHDPCSSCQVDKPENNRMLAALREQAKAGWRLVSLYRDDSTRHAIGVFERTR